MKKRRSTWILLLFSLVFLNNIASAKETENFKLGFSLKLSGGLRYMNVGDINHHIESFDDYMSSHIPLYEGGKMEKINNYGPDLEGELRLDISPKFAVGLGIGYISGKNKSDFQTVGVFPFWEGGMYIIGDLFEFITESKVKTASIKLGIYYTLQIRPGINIFLNSGLSYYFSKWFLYKYNWIVSLDPYSPDEYVISNEYNVRGNGLGFHGGIGFEYKISNTIALVVEVQGRYAKIKNLNGSRIYNSTLTLEQGEDEGILYIGERNDLADEGFSLNYPDLIVSPSRPTGSEFRNIREALFDFSGFSLKAGIRIRLF